MTGIVGVIRMRRKASARDLPLLSVGIDAISQLEAWCGRRGWSPFGFQREAWHAYSRGRSGLIHAPTGVGKTSAAWGGPVAEGLADGDGEGIRVIWLTPLRALASDTAKALRELAEGVGLGAWTIEMRTGDTKASVRARQRRRLPTCLITTPESLSLMLTYPDTAEKMRTLRAVVVDEWHELLGNKRGVQAELCLARLRAWFPELRTWGLSATIGNLDVAMAALLGDRAPGGATIAGDEPKAVEIETLIPASMERFPWSGHLGISMLEQVARQVDRADSTLLFTNTRSQTEIWFQALADLRPGWGDALAMHHGSLERDIREEVERRLAAGEAKCVVCTSSLDLGVDFSPVDQVMQVGSPKGVARIIQRAGRSGHRPGATSRVVGVPTNAFELVEFAAARGAIAERRIESREPLRLALDVLVQHLVTCAIGGGFKSRAMLAEVRSSHAFADLAAPEWRWCLDFVQFGGAALAAYPDFKKVRRSSDGTFRVDDPRMVQLHRMNIGTISSESAISVRFGNGKRLGTVEENFLAKMKPGAQFVFAGRRLELVKLREMVATVRPARRKARGRIPQWMGGKFPLSTELADAVAANFRRSGFDPEAEPEMAAAGPILEIQRAWSTVPEPGELLIEQTRTAAGFHSFVYPFAGRLVHEGLATLCAFRLARDRPRSVGVAFNDYGFELHAAEEFALDEEGWRELFEPRTLLPDLLECMNVHELARRQFREVARVAGLVLSSYPGRARGTRSLQASSGLLFDVFAKYDTDNLLLAQAQREILDRQLEMTRLRAALDEMATATIVLVATRKLTPLAFPLWADQLSAEELSSERYSDRLARMLGELEAAAARPGAPELQPEMSRF